MIDPEAYRLVVRMQLRDLQGSHTSSQFTDLTPQTLRIAKEVDKNPPLKANLLRVMFNNLQAHQKFARAT